MRLPGTRYQEQGWEQVRKLLGHCSLQAFAASSPARLLDAPGTLVDTLADYVDLTAEALHACARTARAEAPANSYGESALELSLSLLYELQARPADWAALCAAVANEHQKIGAFWITPGGDAILRKKINDMYAGVRDKVDSDNYQAACGRSCSPNKMYAYRMLDTAYSDIARLFGAWREHAGQVAAILGRDVVAMPIEVRQMRSIGTCKAEWVLRWSESLERFGGGAGPLHTRSKRFANLKNNDAKITEMLAEIGDYEELSSNRDRDWLHDAGEAANWLEDLWRVSDAAVDEAESRILPAPDSEDDADAQDPDPAPHDAPEPAPYDSAIAVSLSLPPRFMELAWAAQDHGSWSARKLAACSLPVRLAVYLKMLGGLDDSYPGEWLDPATGELPTMQQLAVLDQISLPTLRKRRDAAIASLLEAVP
ncbi:hypothetical protein CR152_26145 [Massilia violaceinigra]|uniref:Uncharacterized protein n=1 Tax=Massilia violaceinigra TaxID=2045208 RepID=A0A2D2DRI7_9BURK|nr:hypothetical protein [Massilia violaceinigra]ATQ77596.1 hypothetical protein CR152_26145 [Massilia violaceinigra]